MHSKRKFEEDEKARSLEKEEKDIAAKKVALRPHRTSCRKSRSGSIAEKEAEDREEAAKEEQKEDSGAIAVSSPRAKICPDSKSH